MTCLVFLVCALTSGRPLGAGAHPSVSPDGRCLAFESVRQGVVGISILNLDSGVVCSIGDERFPTCRPTWRDARTVVFSSCRDARTAYEAAHADGAEGFNLFSWQDGEMRRLTRGRWFDVDAAWMPDGKTFFYVSSENERGARNHLVCVPAGRWEERQTVVTLGGRNCGLASPSVSRNGRLIAWMQFDDPFDVWHLCVADSTAPKNYAPILPENDVGLSPSFHPNSRHLFYTGYRLGDPGWGVWVVDCMSGETERLFDGERPCVTPDGKGLVYEKEGHLWLADLTDVRLPTGRLLSAEDDLSAEADCTVVEAVDPASQIDLPDADFAVERTVFLQVEFTGAGDSSGLTPLVRLVCENHPLALQLYLDKGVPWLATRNRSGERFVGVNSGCRIDSGVHVLTGIRGRDGQLFLALDDQPIQSSRIMRKEDLLRLERAQHLSLGKTSSCVRRVCCGTGWPSGIERLHVRKGWSL